MVILQNCMDFVKTELGSSSETCPDENHFITVKVEVADIQEEVEEDQMLTTFSVSKDEDVVSYTCVCPLLITFHKYTEN